GSVAFDSEMAFKIREAKRSALVARIRGMPPDERRQLVGEARAEDRWRSKFALAEHGRKHLGIAPKQYQAWVQNQKKRGALIYAMILTTPVHDGFAFIDPEKRTLVWFDLEDHRNVSGVYLDETIESFLAEKGS